MFVFDWFRGILESWGLVNIHARLLFLGLDNAGKTTLLHMLRDNRLVQHPPTHHPTSEELKMGNIVMRTYDLGGHTEARQLWKDYFASVDGIVYIIDISDASRFPTVKKELNNLLMCDDLVDVPILVLGNKIDVSGARSEAQLRDAMDMHFTSGKSTTTRSDGIRPMEIFTCSIVEREGYKEGFQWLSHYL